MEQPTTAFFVRGPQPFTRLVFFSILSLVLMGVDARLHYLTEVRQGFMGLLHPLQVAANMPGYWYRQTAEYWQGHDAMLADNRRLRIVNLQQGVDLQRLRSMEEENMHLRQLLGAVQEIKQPAQLAEIMNVDRDPFTQRVVVNLGSRHGIMTGQAVADGMGVIGQVTRTYPFSSEVTLVTDKSLAIPIQVERSGLRAIAFGHGRDNIIDLPYLPTNVDIQEGDVLVTSGIDGVYPPGLAVARVTSVERDSDLTFARIVCEPAAGIEQHRQVLLLKTPLVAAATPIPDTPAVNTPSGKAPTPTAKPKPSSPSSTTATPASSTPATLPAAPANGGT
ncbi:rod shape-determining protein MreC [Pseudomethylobacillus aquaticus]|uniref:Cell shape-determining protein MreC n=1 Tax=Pseudomethylobacillus aquaticus TaxID=2676064 RepID=A0A3N0UV24_9PROT|nr:rod shape-determining protein MreC [Pseudomethylobacillus aquaticus]ROH84068.1 rod shape-determining protein MreC [Pseudomethylobacillus aquaticus]